MANVPKCRLHEVSSEQGLNCSKLIRHRLSVRQTGDPLSGRCANSRNAATSSLLSLGDTSMSLEAAMSLMGRRRDVITLRCAEWASIDQPSRCNARARAVELRLSSCSARFLPPKAAELLDDRRSLLSLQPVIFLRTTRTPREIGLLTNQFSMIRTHAPNLAGR
jgi:hypothetical protein